MKLLSICFGIIIALIGLIYTNLSTSITKLEVRLEGAWSLLYARGERITLLEGEVKSMKETLVRMTTEHHDIIKGQGHRR